MTLVEFNVGHEHEKNAQETLEGRQRADNLLR